MQRIKDKIKERIEGSKIVLKTAKENGFTNAIISNTQTIDVLTWVLELLENEEQTKKENKSCRHGILKTFNCEKCNKGTK